MVGAVAAGRDGVDGAPNTGAAGLSSGPICSVKREIYIASPQPGLAPVINVKYLGEGLRRREIIGQQGPALTGSPIGRRHCSR